MRKFLIIRPLRILNKKKIKKIKKTVVSTGIEPVSEASETAILSVELRDLCFCGCKIKPFGVICLHYSIKFTHNGFRIAPQLLPN